MSPYCTPIQKKTRCQSHNSRYAFSVSRDLLPPFIRPLEGSSGARGSPRLQLFCKPVPRAASVIIISDRGAHCSRVTRRRHDGKPVLRRKTIESVSSFSSVSSVSSVSSISSFSSIWSFRRSRLSRRSGLSRRDGWKAGRLPSFIAFSPFSFPA